MGEMTLRGKVTCRLGPGVHMLLLDRQVGPCEFVVRSIAADGEFRTVLQVGDGGSTGAALIAPSSFGYLASGDIVRVDSREQRMAVMYRRNSRHNTLFVTERCNSRCLMCSQPPRDVDDRYLVDELISILPWMSRDTPELGVTGGEPTLLDQRFIDLVRATEVSLPATSLHVLTNGRRLAYLRYAERLAETRHHDVMLGIPLYADTASAHDHVVQARGAFDETLRGIMNLGRVGLPVEIRVVIHGQTLPRLPALARYIARNLPFAAQVSLMGLELMGFARTNFKDLWVDPVDYQDELETAVSILADAGLRVTIFNHQLCVLRPSLHRFAARAISDWKNMYVPECSSCCLRDQCGGFFSSSLHRHSSKIKAFVHSAS